MKYLLLTLGLLLSVRGLCAEMPQTEIRLEYRTTRMGKPPHRQLVCDFHIKNAREKPVWIVYPGYASDRLPEDGEIKVSYWTPGYFPASGFGIEGGYWPRNPENIGRFVQIHSLAGGDDHNTFYAIRLPAEGEFHFAGYEFPAWEDVDSLQIWVAEDILVNEKTSFSEWFPFDVTASKRVVMKARTMSNENMNWDRSTSATRKDLRQGPVSKLHIKKLEAHVIPLNTADPDKE